MKFLKENKVAIIFYSLVIISTLVLINDAKRDEFRNENKYVMTYMNK